MKRCFKILILFISLFYIFTNTKALEVKYNENEKYHYISKSYFDENKSCSIQLRKYDNGTAGLYIKGITDTGYVKMDTSKKSISNPCGGSFYLIKNITLDNNLESGINNLENVSFVVNSSALNITGIVANKNTNSNDDNQTIICSGADYNKNINRGDKTYNCKITIETDSEGNVHLKYGIVNISNTIEKINPTATKFTCSGAGLSLDFYLNKQLKKGSIKSQSDCPTITSADGDQTDTYPGNSDDTDTADRDTEKEHLDNSDYDTSTNKGELSTGELNCEDFIKGDLLIYIEKILSIMKYAGIVLCIGLTIADFVKAITGDDKDALNKITKKALTRILLVALLFFLPTIINFIIGIVNENACPINF